MYPRITRKIGDSAGFTLVELAAVLIIIGLITSMGMVATLGAVESAKRAATLNRMDAIEKALMDFRNKYHRLPCPADPTLETTDSNSGKESRSGSGCDISSPDSPPYLLTDMDDDTTAAEGGVPAYSLGLPAEFMFDGWGRRFMYAIPTTVGEDQSFMLFIRPQDNQCAGKVVTQTTAVRSNGPVYVLTSFGPNGHGAFIDGTARTDANVTNSSELINCHCTSTGVFDTTYNGSSILQWVQDYHNENSSDPADTFDDIVRYKERWQMQNADDYKKSADYKDYVLAAGYEEGALALFKFNGCTRDWEDHPDSDVTSGGGFLTPDGLPGGDYGQGVIFDKSTIFWYTNSTTNPIQPYYVTRDSIEESTCTAIYDCVPTVPEASLGGVQPFVSSANHYAALAYAGGAPYIQMYRARNTDSETPFLSPVSTPSPHVKPSAHTTLPTLGDAYGQQTNPFFPGNSPDPQPTLVVFSSNAEYLFLSDRDTYATMYARVDDSTYKKMFSTYQPSSGFTQGDVGSAAFSPDGKYFMMGLDGLTPSIEVWKLRPGTWFTTGTNPFVDVTFTSATFPGSVAPMMAFSPDGKYFVAASGEGSGAVSAADNIRIYKVENNDVFTNITANIEGSYAVAETVVDTAPILFTPDSNQFVVAASHAGGGTILEFEKVSADTWRLSAPVAAAFPNDAPTVMAITPP